jgi:hypothetical protein
MRITPKEMAQAAKEVLSLSPRKESAQDKTFRSFFGAPIGVITDIWNRLEESLDQYAQPKHLYWGLVLIKRIYSTEEVHCRICGWPDPKTYRKRSWYFVEKVSSLEESVILLDN